MLKIALTTMTTITKMKLMVMIMMVMMVVMMMIKDVNTTGLDCDDDYNNDNDYHDNNHGILIRCLNSIESQHSKQVILLHIGVTFLHSVSPPL